MAIPPYKMRRVDVTLQGNGRCMLDERGRERVRCPLKLRPFTMTISDVQMTYPTFYHFEVAARYIPHEPGMADKIRNTPSIEDAEKLSDVSGVMMRPDWEDYVRRVWEEYTAYADLFPFPSGQIGGGFSKAC